MCVFEEKRSLGRAFCDPPKRPPPRRVPARATLILRRDGPAPSFLFFVPAVAISAWYGGPGPAILATIASLLLIDLNFLAPGGSLRIDRVEALEIIAFIIVAATIITTMEALHRALALAESRAAELKRLNEEVGRSYDAEREKRHDAELLAHAREEVLGVVAHDLRNPLNLIITSTDLLLAVKGVEQSSADPPCCTDQLG